MNDFVLEATLENKQLLHFKDELSTATGIVYGIEVREHNLLDEMSIQDIKQLPLVAIHWFENQPKRDDAFMQFTGEWSILEFLKPLVEIEDTHNNACCSSELAIITMDGIVDVVQLTTTSDKDKQIFISTTNQNNYEVEDVLAWSYDIKDKAIKKIERVLDSGEAIKLKERLKITQIAYSIANEMVINHTSNTRLLYKKLDNSDCAIRIEATKINDGCFSCSAIATYLKTDDKRNKITQTLFSQLKLDHYA